MNESIQDVIKLISTHKNKFKTLTNWLRYWKSLEMIFIKLYIRYT